MFCGNCGAQNLENATFCKECGAPINSTSSISTSSGEKSVQSNQAAGKKNQTIGIAAAAIVVIIIAISLFGGRGYKSTARKFVDASLTANGKAFVSLLPNAVVECACEDEDMTKKEFTKYLTEELEDNLETVDDYYDKWSYSQKIAEVEDFSTKELKSLREDYEDEFDVKIKAAKTVTIDITITADDDTEVLNSFDVVVIKIGNSWYVDISSMGGLF